MQKISIQIYVYMCTNPSPCGSRCFSLVKSTALHVCLQPFGPKVFGFQSATAGQEYLAEQADDEAWDALGNRDLQGHLTDLQSGGKGKGKLALPKGKKARAKARMRFCPLKMAASARSMEERCRGCVEEWPAAAGDSQQKPPDQNGVRGGDPVSHQSCCLCQ